MYLMSYYAPSIIQDVQAAKVNQRDKNGILKQTGFTTNE